MKKSKKKYHKVNKLGLHVVSELAIGCYFYLRW